MINTSRLKISKEEYEEYKDKPYVVANHFVESHISEAIICGYGYYGFAGFEEKDGNYYALYKRGSSCD